MKQSNGQDERLERLERLAEAYATHQGFPRKGEGDCRDSYDTLMKYEVRGYVSDAWLAGYKAALESEEVRGLIDMLESAQCECSIAERASGHLVGCWAPDRDALLARFRGESNGT